MGQRVVCRDAGRRRLTVVQDRPRCSDIATLLGSAVASCPDAIAVVDGGKRITYRELDLGVRRVAHHLHTLGVQRGTGVAVIGSPIWETVVTMYAALALGASVVPLNSALGERELLYVLQHSAIEVLVGAEPALIPERHRMAGLSALASTATSIRAPRLRAFVPLRGGSCNIADIMSVDVGGELQPTPATLRFYTSKHGDFLRGVNVPLASALRCGDDFGARLGMSERDRHLALLPLSSPTGFIDVVLASHVHHGSVVLAGRFDPGKAVRVAVRERCTLTGGSAVPIGRFLEAAEHRFADDPDGFPIERFWSVPTLPARAGAGLGMQQYTCYGLTEAGNIVSASSQPLEDGEAVHHGEALPGIEVRIIDPVADTVLPAGELGEICFRGSALTDGYHRGSHLLGEQVDDHGFFHTRDYGIVDERGRLVFVESRSDCLRSGGELVSLAEVERVIESECDDVVRVLVIGVPEPHWGDIVVAFIEAEPTAEVTLHSVRAECSAMLAAYKLPRIVVQIPTGEWPRTPFGDVDSVRLKMQAEQAVKHRLPTVPVRGDRPAAMPV